MFFLKIYKIMPASRRKQVPFVALAMVIGGALEAIGIGLIMPLISTILGSDNEAIDIVRRYFEIDDERNIAIASIVIFSVLYAIKGLYLSALVWITSNFSYAVKAEVGNNLLEGYLYESYEFHLKRNSAQLIRNVTTEVTQFAVNAVKPSLEIASEAIVILAIGALLFTVEPVGTIIVVFLILISSYAFHKFTKKKLIEFGETRQHADGMILKSAQEALSGIKEVQLSCKEFTFFTEFSRYNGTASNSVAKLQFISQLPRMYLEVLGIFVFSVLSLFLLMKNQEYAEIVPVLAVFSLAGFRLLPSANRILSAASALRFSHPVVNNIYKEIDLLKDQGAKNKNKNAEHKKINFQDVIEITGVSYKYPESKNYSLSDVNLMIRRGESVGIVGKSGAGKSTLLDVIIGLLKPTSGSVSVDGINISDNIKGWQTIIGYVQQDTFLLDASVKQNIAFLETCEEIDNKKLTDAIDQAQLSELIENLPEGINTQLGERGVRLSGGQKQRIAIARALYRNTPIVIFDEATSALDYETESGIVSAIERLKGARTIIVIAHRLSTIEHCDRVIHLRDGAIKGDRSAGSL
jgi:ABC-type multidrug transport system fused ATPase/permease subunit